jgi:replicative DNA helicase
MRSTQPTKKPGGRKKMTTTPHDKTAEMALIGALLVHEEAFPAVSTTVVADDFYDPTCRAMWRAAERLHKKGMAIDALTISSELPEEISRTTVSNAVSSLPMGGDWSSYAKVVADLAVYRKMIAAAHDIARVAYARPESLDLALDEAQKRVFALTSGRGVRSTLPTEGIARKILNQLDSVLVGGVESGVPTGLRALDEMTGGWQKSDLVIIAARPSVGKTALAIGAARWAAQFYGKRVAIYSLEMSAHSIGTRLLSSMSGVGTTDIMRGRISGANWVRLAAGVGKMKRANILVDDSPTISPAELRSRARQIKQSGGLDLIIVDYLQLMVSDRQTRDANRVVEVSDISRSLKALARELDVPVIALSQLNRLSEHRDAGEPRLSDLRDSGAIEQDADVVMMLWRPNGQTHGEPVEDIKLTIAKHRNGPTGEIALRFMKSTTTFVEEQ